MASSKKTLATSGSRRKPTVQAPFILHRVSDDDDKETAVSKVVGDIRQLLKQLSNREVGEALAQVSVLYRLRVIPQDRPIGLPSGKGVERQNSTASESEAPRKGKGPSQPTKSAWKKDPRWVRAQREHDEVVQSLKDEKDPEVRKAMLQDLRIREVELKALKGVLRPGEVESSAGAEDSTTGAGIPALAPVLPLTRDQSLGLEPMEVLENKE